MRTIPTLLLLLLLASCSREPARLPDVIVIVMDTVRLDHMGFAGYPRATTPELDRFARSATYHPRAKATAPWTLPSHASLFTGLYPFEHGARGYWHPSWTPELLQSMATRGNVRGLGQGPLTLAEWLTQRGYRSGAVVANDVFLGERYGVQRGFAHYDLGLEPAPRINERALRWLDQQGQAPVFLFLNYMDAHKPYNCAPIERLGSEPDYDPELNRRVMRAAHTQDPPPDPRELEQVIRWYDLGIANLDAALGELFEALRARGRFDDALIVVTSDHGEYFGEHALYGHSKDVYEEAMAIPLLVKTPRQREAGRSDALVSLAQIPDLIRRVVAPDAEGLPFASLAESELLGELHGSRMKDLLEPWGARFLRVRTAYYRDHFKLIHSTDGRHELYDLDVGPETQDLHAARADLAGAMREGMDAFLLSRTRAMVDSLTAEESELSPEEIERLRALGYQ